MSEKSLNETESERMARLSMALFRPAVDLNPRRIEDELFRLSVAAPEG